MALFNKTPEEIAAKEAAKDAEAKRKAAERFKASPAGQARAAYRAGNTLFQVSFTIRSNRGNADSGFSRVSSSEHDNTDTLNAIGAEGWKFEALSTTFVHTGTVTTEKWISNGSREGVSGYVMGTYVFSRRPDATPTN
jgi:hypothetical protein